MRTRPRRLAGGAVLLVVLVVAIALAALGSLSHTSSRDARLGAGTAVVSPAAIGHPAPPAAQAPSAPAPPGLGHAAPVTAAATRLQTALNKLMAQAGPQSGALVADLTSHDILYSAHAGVARAPASVEKLWTTAAVMLKLGPQARLPTTILGTGSQRGGVWHGNLYVRGGGDPTLGDAAFNHYWNHGAGPTAAQLVAQLLARGIHRVTGHVYADESLFDSHRGGMETGLAADIPDYEGQLSALTYDHGTTARGFNPATFTAHELVLTMRGSHMTASASPHDATTPAGAHVLATVFSPPLAVMTRLMDVPSDDLFADLFTKLLGQRFGSGGSIAAGAAVISRTIAQAYGLHPRILDGSGLARGDRSSPLQIVQLLRGVWHTSVGGELVASLPTVGRTGTVQYIAAKTAAAGRCVAKTGTLNFVTNLAGYCRAQGGHTLAFALFADGPWNAAADALEGRMVGAIARY